MLYPSSKNVISSQKTTGNANPRLGIPVDNSIISHKKSFANVLTKTLMSVIL